MIKIDSARNIKPRPMTMKKLKHLQRITSFKSSRPGKFNQWLSFKKQNIPGDFPGVQWLRICLPMQGTQVQSQVGELRSHMPQSN